MPSLHAVQLIGKYDSNTDKIVWQNALGASIAEKGIYVPPRTNEEYGYYKGHIFDIDTDSINGENYLIINKSTNNIQPCTIVYFSVQGVPGSYIYINENSSPYRIGHTGIMEFDIYNDNPVTSIKIVNNSNVLLQDKDLNFYGNNEKYIVDIIYKINESNI